jgi:hypothetical protein
MDNQKIFFHVTDQELAPSDITYDNIVNIDNYQDNSIQEVVIQNMCDYLKRIDVPLAIQKIFQKISQGGRLYVQGSDLKQLCVAMCFSMIEDSIVENILYPDKQSIHNMSDILNYLRATGFKIEQKKYINIVEYSIVAYKP